jgi:MraZ protein
MELQHSSDQPPILTSGDDCLCLHPFERWCDLERRVVEKAAIDPTARDFARLMISSASEAPIDKQGRILVPPHLRKQAHLEREVTIAGVGLSIEIWDATRFEVHMNQTQADFRRISENLADKVGA